MTLLAAYDRICTALVDATQFNRQVMAARTEVEAIRNEIEHLKLHARLIRDRELLAKATVAQMKFERELGTMLSVAIDAGHIVEGRPPKNREPGRFTLKEIGVDVKLSSRAQKAAALDDEAFEQLAESARDKIKSGGAILVDPIKAAAKDAEVADRRAQHARRTEKGGCVADLGALALTGKRFGSIGSDPQWKFLTRSAAGEGRSANVHYKTEEVDKIKDLPVNELLADDGAFYMWMVDWCPQDALDLLAHWGLRHVTTAFTWIKTNGEGALDIWDKSTWHMGQGYWTRANPEQCWLATKGNPKRLYADVRQLIVAPVMEHSRKPDEWLDRIERLTEGDYLELQARRPRRGWVSWGDELEWTGVAA